MHEHTDEEIERRAWLLAERFVEAVEKIARSLSHPHPAPGMDPNTHLILEAIAKTGEKLMSQGQDLLAAVGRVQDQISPIADKITEVGGEVQQVLALLNGDNPDVAQAIQRLSAVSTSLTDAGAALQGVDDALDTQLGTGGGTGTGAPTITSFSPNAGGVGSTVTLSGTNLFRGSTSIAFGSGAAAPITDAADDGSSANVLVPSDATSGTITASNAAGSGTSTDEFTVQ
jgi:hypothetical protein